jgi:hypothetical protein
VRERRLDHLPQVSFAGQVIDRVVDQHGVEHAA